MHKYFQHHEQACAMAAEAYARYSGRMAAVCVTSGPGATNTLTGVVGAWQDSLPMIVLSGQVRYEISVAKSGLPLRYRGIQEYDIVPVVKHMTKYAVMITDPRAIRKELVKAVQIAMDGRRGPVWLDIPQDIQNAQLEEKELYEVEPFLGSCPEVSTEKLERIFQILEDASRPCILAGSGIQSSHSMEAFEEFADRMNIPVIGGAWVADNFYLEHPLYFGPSGNIGPRTGNFILQNADVLLVLGNSLGFRQTGFHQEGFAPYAKIYMVDADANEAEKPGLRIEELVHAELKQFFNAAKKCKVDRKDHVEWLTYCNRLKQKFSPYEAIEKGVDGSDRVCAYYFWKEFEKYESEDTILALGNNTANSAKLQIGIRKKGERVITNYTCGSMGYDVPAAIGAAVASGKKVYCMTGDGSIMMNLQELQTIVQYDLQVDLIIFSNEGYGAIRQTSKNFFDGQYIGCTPDTGVSFPDFKKVADLFGFVYLCCHNNSEIEESLAAMSQSDNRVLLEIKQAFDDHVTPKVMSRLDEAGRMQSPVLQDMYPFLDEAKMKLLMF
jgi:acetolactate synthase-1/2/3 large subunit